MESSALILELQVCIAGEGLYKILQKPGVRFIKESINLIFADGRSAVAVLSIQMNSQIRNRTTIRIDFIILLKFKVYNLIFYMISIDLFEPLPEEANGNR
ncbi:hypothetical protein CDAR_23151 [Caerostris darwini]|uniref:Uncharacterized protein n=1 Tax=Caerostris darwini TaxID=1538125 RepID=A0AAV4QEX0_9ARAC|nr:hypothetical protein CDAR_23151 [Caerostris darwini]